PGEIVVIGGGDASLGGPLTKTTTYPPVARLSDLAAQVRTALVGAPVSRVVDGGRIRPSPSRAPRRSDPALAAGHQLAALLGAPKATVVRGRAADGAKELGSVSS